MSLYWKLIGTYGNDMYLDVLEVTVSFGKFEGMTRISVHMSIAQRRASVTEEMYDLVNAFLVAGKKVPKGS